MKAILSKVKKCFQTHPDAVLAVIAILYGLMFLPAIIIQDDLKWLSSVDTLKNTLKLVYSQYYTWSSRVIINLVWYLVLRFGKVAWALYMAVSAFVLMKALRLLSDDDHNHLIHWFSVTMLMLFPSVFFVSAGWIATTTSYFGPQAFGLMALVPIKKCLKDEKIGKWEWVFYLVCLIYAANAEQMCVVLLGCYLTAAVYFAIRKKRNLMIWFFLLVVIASFVFMLSCSGNWARKDQEIIRWFPTYGMLDNIDKADIGISTTLHWMFAESSLIVIFICLMLTFLVWKRYKGFLFRCLAVLPLAAVLFLGPLKNVLTAVFPYASFISYDVDYYGSFTVGELGGGVGRIRFALFLFIALCIAAEVILLNDTVTGLLVDSALIITGFGSRVMMAFSPTVYMSNIRTYSTLVVCLFAFAMHMFSHNLSHLNVHEKQYARCMMAGIILFGIVDLACLVATYGHS